ncbi:MAG: DUF4269 domain-containing protein, partial [bacterium]|nr:DUF4269 domain-containing protein [bacterium]
MIKFDTIEYLKIGTSKQRNVYRVLTENKIIESLFEFSPILTGTVPIEIDTDDSDLDIACFWTDKYNFIKTISTFSN